MYGFYIFKIEYIPPYDNATMSQTEILSELKNIIDDLSRETLPATIKENVSNIKKVNLIHNLTLAGAVDDSVKLLRNYIDDNWNRFKYMQSINGIGAIYHLILEQQFRSSAIRIRNEVISKVDGYRGLYIHSWSDDIKQSPSSFINSMILISWH